MSKKLIAFLLVYYFITWYFIHTIQSAAHGGEIIVVILPAIWIAGLFFLILLYSSDRSVLKGRVNKFIFFLCTPVPTILFICGYLFWENNIEPQHTITYEKRGGYVIQTTDYPHRKRTEYRSNFDSKTGDFLMDSITYFDEDKDKFVTYRCTGWERYK